MLFNHRERRTGFRGQRLFIPYYFLCIAVAVSLIFTIHGRAEMIERVVAIVNDEVILYSELQNALREARGTEDYRSEEEVLDGLIDRILILDRAKAFKRIEDSYIRNQSKENIIIDEYIEKRIKSVVYVSFSEIKSFYHENRRTFGDREIYAVWDDIERQLKSEKLKVKLKDHIVELRKKADIRIQRDLSTQ